MKENILSNLTPGQLSHGILTQDDTFTHIRAPKNRGLLVIVEQVDKGGNYLDTLSTTTLDPNETVKYTTHPDLYYDITRR